MKKNKKGFSFVELIVVVAIIAVLSMAAIISYGPIQKKSRDSRRVADLEKIKMALEMARQIGTTYPATDSVQTVLVPNFMQTYPTDPKPVLPYLYTQVTPYTFTIYAKMEDAGSTNCPTTCGSYNYRVTNP